MSGSAPPSPQGPLVDRDGKITRQWWWYLFSLWQAATGGGAGPTPVETTTLTLNQAPLRDYGPELRELRALSLAQGHSSDVEQRLRNLEMLIAAQAARPAQSRGEEIDMVIGLTVRAL